MKHLFQKYIIHPLRLLFSNGSVFIAFFAVILANYFSSSNPIPLSDTGRWAFVILPESLLSLVTRANVLLIALAGILVKAWLTLVVAKEMLHIYQHSRIGLIDSIKRITRVDFLWYLTYQVAIYAAFAAIALAFYLPAYFAYHGGSADLSIGLLVVFGFFYPAFYICLSTGSMVAVMSIPSSSKISILRFLLTGRRITALYAFYFARITLELGLLFLVPFVAVAIFKQVWLATLSAVVGLLIPFALMRGTAYELKLELLKDWTLIRSMFQKHYADD